MIEHIDTGESSIIHWLFSSLPTEPMSIFKHYAVPYVITALATYGVMLITAILSPPSIILRSQSIRIPFLLDANTNWMFLISLPLLIVFIVTERIMIPSGIGKLKGSGVLSITSDSAYRLKIAWEKRYKVVNILGQIVGIGVGVSAGLTNYITFTQTGFGSWQAIDGSVYLVGWYSLLCMFFFYFACSVFITRNIATIVFLRDIVRNSVIQIIPFHPDKCGGLNPVGVLGLRNQYLLSLIGINVILLFSNANILDPNIKLQTMVTVSIAAYIIFGPISFLGPLLPFRDAMQKDKSRLMNLVANRIKMDFNRIIKLIDEGEMTKEDEELLTRYKNIGELVEKLPVWPFDIATISKFITAYILPFVTMIIATLLPDVIKFILP